MVIEFISLLLTMAALKGMTGALTPLLSSTFLVQANGKVVLKPIPKCQLRRLQVFMARHQGEDIAGLHLLIALAMTASISRPILVTGSGKRPGVNVLKLFSSSGRVNTSVSRLQISLQYALKCY